jgi:malate dehydrogenase (oxaloacetate-decarboxylating)
MSKSFKNDFLIGHQLLQHPLLNKGTAFSHAEREKFKLFGLLPERIETIEQQLQRCNSEFYRNTSPLSKHIYLRALQDNNEVLFYRFLKEHIEETLPIIYTPTVGEACEQFHHIYRKSRGLFLNYPDRNHLRSIFENVKKERDVKVIVMTDGERILGLGDQGVGGLGIPIGKLSLYSVCGGIHPKHTLPIVLDVGTNNMQLINDIQYFGWKHPRLTGKRYFDFVDECIQILKEVFPNVLLQFEDFAQHNAHAILQTYQDELCCFNDDIQGTAAVASSTVIAAIRQIKGDFRKQKYVIYGAGSAGCGFAQLLVNIMIQQGENPKEAYQRFYMIDRNGLIHDQMQNLLEFQKPFAQPYESIRHLFPEDKPILLEQVIDNIHPQLLIGVSGQKGHFTQAVVEKMCHYQPHPIIFPLSNPNDKCEATPEDILNWSQGQAIVATGSPFTTFYNGQLVRIPQCNNAYIFPGMGLAVLAGKIPRVTQNMFIAAALALSKHATTSLLPELHEIREVSCVIAKAVIQQAIKDGLCQLSEIEKAIDETMWDPHYE